MSDRREQLLDLLARADRWFTAAELGDQLGVTPRSVRSYVTAVKTDAAPFEPVRSGSAGYRLDRAEYARWRAASGATEATSEESGGPTARATRLLRRLVDAPAGLDAFATAAELHVSESTLEGDLTRVRARLDGTGLSLRRSGGTLVLDGTESARRRLLGTLFREESARGMLELAAIQREFPTEGLAEFKTDLIAELTRRGAAVNEYGLSNVLLHIAIAVDRVRRHHTLQSDGEPATDAADVGLASVVDGLVARHFDVRLGAEDVAYLGYLVETRVATPAQAGPDARRDDLLDADDLAELRRIAVQAGREFLIDLDDGEFLTRLALHVRNLVARANDLSYSRNPLTRSIKAGYPLTYELAVYIANELQTSRGISINEDEIAYIAMHVGALVEQRRRVDDDLVTCSIVSPSYYELHLTVLARIESAVGSDLDVQSVVTRTDVDWRALPGDIVISTVEPPVPDERVIVIAPFLTDGDIERVRAAVSRIRRHRRRARLAVELERYFQPELFLRDVVVADEEAMIRLLGERMRDLGIIDDAYITGAIERERLSSTAFTDTLAVPHALAMTARRTSIAIVLSDSPIDWNGARVNVVAFIAFSESDRSSFQDVFDQFVEVFSEHDSVHRLLRNARDYPSFIEELVHALA
ncbi:MAG: PTS sugar transporter subunit IIA [Leifsonia flava]